MNHADITPN